MAVDWKLSTLSKGWLEAIQVLTAAPNLKQGAESVYATSQGLLQPFLV